MTSYPDSVRFLYALGNEIKTAKLGLERIRALLKRLGNPQDSLRAIHIAGTNGKGSVCAMIDSCLRRAGSHTGLYTSPHLVEPAERIRIDGVAIEASTFSDAFDRVHKAAVELMDRGTIDCHPTYFETVTAMAFVVFARAQVDRVVLEVGLGGRLDATNVVEPELCVITPIDFDHERYLGSSIESIAMEKAGILKTGVPAVFARQRPEAATVLRSRAEEIATPFTGTEEWRLEEVRLSARGSSFRAERQGKTLEIACPLAGQHQVENALTAAAALDLMGFDAEEISKGIAAAEWPGRLERVATRPEIVLDGAHNPAGTRALATHVERFYSGRGRKLWLIFGAMRDKAVSEMTAILFPLFDEVVVTSLKSSRAMRPEAFASLCEHPRLRSAETLSAALALVRGEAADEDCIFIAGSLFLVGEARQLLVR